MDAHIRAVEIIMESMKKLRFEKGDLAQIIFHPSHPDAGGIVVLILGLEYHGYDYRVTTLGAVGGFQDEWLAPLDFFHPGKGSWSDIEKATKGWNPKKLHQKS